MALKVGNLEASHLPLAVTYHFIVDLKSDPSNPRVHTATHIKQMVQGIRAYGFIVPLVVDGNLNVIAGHGRLLALKELDWVKVPVIRVEHLSPQELKAFQVFDNQITDNSAFDKTLLSKRILDLHLSGLDLTVFLPCFTTQETGIMIDSASSLLSQPDDQSDTLPPVPGPAVSKLGDLWLLGAHRIYCGNALDEDCYSVLMDGKQAVIVVTDPPYGQSVSEIGGLGAIKHREFPMCSGEMNEAERIEFFTKANTRLAQNSADGAIVYIFCDWRHVSEMITAGRQTFTELKNICCWVKDNGGMGSFYRSQHEFVLVWKHGKAPHQNHIELGRHGRYRTNVWNYAGVNSFARSTEEGNLLELHPSVKSVALLADVLLDASSRGEIVMDSFLGSGSTLIAAEKTSRICYGMELDPLYVDTTIRRWQRFTGKQARHGVTGRLFDEMAVERCSTDSMEDQDDVVQAPKTRAGKGRRHG